MNDLMTVVAAPFKKKKKEELSAKEFEFILSLDFKWMSPGEASRIRKLAIDSGILKAENEVVKPFFDIKDMEVDHGFKPSGIANMLDQNPGILDLIINRIISRNDINKKEVVSRINQKQEMFSEMLNIEILALMVAREMDCNVDDIYDRLYDKIINSR
ncbi:Protein of unknown function DUF2240 [Methanosalsum zhilinae DSM 4017]|uniref:DUF2240 family protein n=1 Tax=Methanosalsum zhilinae (strain DSM 4017 / NBRC 107636 / OCM 62 / WeN5) TaxID=679901 RepID=F7XLP6_METZD|nr:DUF2240 family protein [Methanosalsum zhilinae]AEH60874.1 Protein of unknown function DUF2240 [Methanosalsum zhilinae DSM 4017]